jgi:hypothetical protein
MEVKVESLEVYGEHRGKLREDHALFSLLLAMDLTQTII